MAGPECETLREREHERRDGIKLKCRLCMNSNQRTEFRWELSASQLVSEVELLPALACRLGPHRVVLGPPAVEPRENTVVVMELMEGIHVVVTRARGAVQSVRVHKVKGAAAGLEPGDFIQSIDGQSITGMGIDEVAMLASWPAGTVSLLLVRRGELQLEVEVERRPDPASDPAAGQPE